ncbi:hypothetical protein C2E23DRAFT_620178 [Lenzites betulinus]|nr:hypothetical protein C2E23DRAFT_620178 [Lenzites betulinus]
MADSQSVAVLGYGGLWRAMDTSGRAFAHNALLAYFNVTAAPNFWSSVRQRILTLLALAGGIYRRRMLAVAGGAAFVVYSTPVDTQPPWVLFRLPVLFLNWFRPAEVVKRMDEYAVAIRAQMKDALGAGIGEMFEIQILATAPEAQGHGYGTALVRAVTAKADAAGRDTFVLTSGARGFYEREGFALEGTAVLGVMNPTWSGAPVHMNIMRRRAQHSDLE